MEISSVFKTSTIDDCKVISLPKFATTAGHITAINNQVEIPFNTKRVYYLYDIPSGETRGGHAHYNLHQLIVGAMGSFDVVLHDGKNEKRISLNQPNQGLLVVPGIWRGLENFSAGSILLVLASEEYDEKDYIRSVKEFNTSKQH
jgi:dTDP-4-dehydrorhamnose 3,5-epimerase-like enzyme